MRETILLFLAMLILVAPLSSCATIMGQAKHDVNITSNPNCGIEITDGKGKVIFSGQTPTIVSLKSGAGFFKGADYTVKFTKAGSSPVAAKISRGLGGWYIFGNLIFGGLVGWLVVDPATGAMWTLKDMHVDLDAPVSAAESQEVHFVSVDDVPEHLRSELVRIN